jgi:hypothetical protein
MNTDIWIPWTERVLAAVFEVSNILGTVYKRHWLFCIRATTSESISPTSSVEDKLAVELKSSNLGLCFLVNFQKSKVEWQPERLIERRGQVGERVGVRHRAFSRRRARRFACAKPEKGHFPGFRIFTSRIRN